MHIAIVGNIGAGKTTLTNLLAKHYGWEALYEAVDNNPYLEDFYSDMKRWSFNLQIYFLNSRLKQLLEIHPKLNLQKKFRNSIYKKKFQEYLIFSALEKETTMNL